MKQFLAIAAVLALTGTIALGDNVIVDNFNSGVFVPGSARPAVGGPPPDSYPYDADGDTIVDPYNTWPVSTPDGWRLFQDNGTEYPADTTGAPGGGIVQVDIPEAWFGSLNPSAHNIGEGPGPAGQANGVWDGDDGNIGSFYQKYNDVPKGGWRYTTALTAAMGGARDANGDALAFAVVADVEQNWVHYSRSSASQANVRLNIGGTQVANVYSPWFYDTSFNATVATIFPITPQDVDVTAAAKGTVLDTGDATSLWRIPGGIASGVIDMTSTPVADGTLIAVRFAEKRANNWDPASGSEWIYQCPAIDNLRVVALRAGDTDGDIDVDFTDFVNLANNYQTGTTWAQGDGDGDADVDFTDFVNLSNNYDGGAGYVPGVQDAPGEVELTVDIITGQMTLNTFGASVNLNGYSIRSASGSLIPDGDNNASPFAFYLSNTANDVTAGNLGLIAVTDLALDAQYGSTQDLVFEYGTSAGAIAGEVNYVPEPATVGLLAFGGIAALLRRRRR
jgi:hypothetical protein